MLGFKDNFSKWTTLFFVAMTIFAIFFAFERFQADGAHYLLHVVQSESFRVEHQRYILIFSQALPWTGVQLEAPLSIIVFLNSLNPVVWWLLCFLYASRFLRDRHAAIGILLTHVLGVLHIQFTPMYEIWYGIPLVILLYSHLRKERTSRIIDLLLFGGILVTVLFAHPLLPITVLFVFIYDFIEKRKLNWRAFIPAIVLTAGWYITKKLLLTDYESGKMSLLGADWNNAPAQFMQIGFYWKLFVYFMTWYTIPMLLLAWLALFFGLRKMKWQLLATLAFVVGHMLLISLTHELDVNQSPYFERMYLPLIPIILIPFLFTLCRELEFSPSFIIMSLLLVVGWRIGRFADVGHDYKHRTWRTQELIRQAQLLPGNKFILSQEDYHSCLSWVDWSFPMHTLLLSTANESFQKRVTIVTSEDLDENDNRTKLDEDEFLFRRWEIMKDGNLNQKYFHISSGKYEPLPAVCDK